MKRGSSGLSFIVGIDKPCGMSSHDVVNRCRRIFNESRVGHNGTLDPLASGVLLVCVGPATRLNPYLTMQDKRYTFRVTFGVATDTDDAAGEVIRTGDVPEKVYDLEFARLFIEGLVGKQQQMPPMYSAIKVNGERAYKAARSGSTLDLEPRDIEIYEALLLGLEEGDEDGYPSWEISVTVSKGTYIRALARDIGKALGVPAYVSELRRTNLGLLGVEDCVNLENLEQLKEKAAIDPIGFLGFRLMFARDDVIADIGNGSPLSVDEIFSCPTYLRSNPGNAGTTNMIKSEGQLRQDEMISVISENELMGLYRYDEKIQQLKAHCIFAVGVSRGKNN